MRIRRATIGSLVIASILMIGSPPAFADGDGGGSDGGSSSDGGGGASDGGGTSDGGGASDGGGTSDGGSTSDGGTSGEADGSESDGSFGDPGESDPGSSDPSDSDPNDSDPDDSDPADADPEVADPEVADPEVADPEVTDPEVTDPEVATPTEDAALEAALAEQAAYAQAQFGRGSGIVGPRGSEETGIFAGFNDPSNPGYSLGQAFASQHDMQAVEASFQQDSAWGSYGLANGLSAAIGMGVTAFTGDPDLGAIAAQGVFGFFGYDVQSNYGNFSVPEGTPSTPGAPAENGGSSGDLVLQSACGAMYVNVESGAVQLVLNGSGETCPTDSAAWTTAPASPAPPPPPAPPAPEPAPAPEPVDEDPYDSYCSERPAISVCIEP
jgi:hypothetical protein